MLSWGLNFAYAMLLLVCSPWLIWRSLRQGKYRHGWGQKFLGLVPLLAKPGAGPRVWLHAVSVGEVLQLRQVLDRLRAQLPDADFIVSTTTETGYQVAAEKLGTVHVVYFPLDFTWAVSNALQRLRPTLIVLVELELWPNFILAAHRAGIPVGLINGRLSERSFHGYRRFRPLITCILQRLEFIAVQTAEYQQRFLGLGARADRCHVTGSIKFDGARADRTQPLTRELREYFGISEGSQVFIAGSTQDPEELIAAQVYLDFKSRFPDLRLIVVPRHPDRANDIARQLEGLGLTVIRRSARRPAVESHRDASVALLDTVGELGACWGLATVAFVGGSFGNRGGQNMLEPAAYGAAVCFGPNTQNFRQIVELLLQAQAACVVADSAALGQFLAQMLENPASRTAMGERARQLVMSQQGATDRSVQLIMNALP